jgi:phytoene synthase
MAVQAHGWERRLIDLAQEALESQIAAALHGIYDDDDLRAAYHVCEQITKSHSRTFMLASGLLPRAKRRGARALYAFCRVCDNLVDAPQTEGDPRETLERWRCQVLDVQSAGDDPVAMAWADTRIRYQIPWRYAEQLIAGVTQDIEKHRYRTFDELAEYCYGVASTVGLMAMHIIGFQDNRALPYAVKLGVALQLTNILRDVGEDWRNGRLYLPQDELAQFGLSEADVAAGLVDDRWRALMQYQIQRTRQLFDEALPGVALLESDGRFAITAAAQLYRYILDDIEAHDYDVFQRRAHVTTWGKLRRLPGIWNLSKRLALEVEA